MSARKAAARVVTLLAAIALVSGLAPATGASAATSCTTGPYQRQVERYLGLAVNGRNSAADCARIKAFQKRYGVKPVAGYAGPTTYGLVKRLKLAKANAGRCVTRSKVVCVDLTSQTVWIARNGTRVWGPWPVRSGRNGYETRTGKFRVYRKNIDHVSSIYGTPMPYAMFFSGGQAFHTSDRYLYNSLGSHGCVHIVPRIARDMWDRVGTGTAVHSFGRKPGT